MTDFEPIEVSRGGAGPFPGVRTGRVAAYDFPLPQSLYVRPGLPHEDRAYLLLDHGIQLSCPPGLPEPQAGWWYVDLVEISENHDRVAVTDHYLDVIIGPPGHYYRVLDMDEFGDAVASGALSAEQAVRGLRNFQRFLDTHLNRRHDVTLEWPDFPPRAIESLRALPSLLR